MRTIISGKPGRPLRLLAGQSRRATPGRSCTPISAPRREEELRLKLGDDFRWIARLGSTAIPTGRAACSTSPDKRSMAIRARSPTAKPRPRSTNLRLAEARVHELRHNAARICQVPATYYRASGLWTCFYHNVMDLFGMENYMAIMYERPEIVHAVTDRVCQFYYDANELFFALAGDDATPSSSAMTSAPSST